LFGTTSAGGGNGGGTVFEIAKTATGYAATHTVLVSLCCFSQAGLIADSAGNLFGTTERGGTSNVGTVFEVSRTGFVIFAGIPGKANCHTRSAGVLFREYGSLPDAATALGYSSIAALRNAIGSFCAG
jgi:uncharacterized repeat protein (TIGR03803 family)